MKSPAPFIEDPKIERAIELLRNHEAASKACMDFLKAEKVAGYDPISLKLWLAERITQGEPEIASTPAS